MKTLSTDTCIIGGGAAGLLAAGYLGQFGLKTIIVEPNKLLGKKLRITGKGRCNLTNNCEVKQFLENVPVNSKFLYGAINTFTPADTMLLFEKLGVPLKTERGARVFPQSDNAHDAANALERFAKKGGACHLQERAVSIKTANGEVCGVITDQSEISCKKVLLCTGGASYPGTGSTGDGYEIASALGHTIVPPKPSLVPLETADDYCEELSGFSLKNVTFSIVERETGKPLFSELGELLFTHFGISGPLVLSASSHLRGEDFSKLRAFIDLKPGLDEKQLDDRILRDFAKYANKEFKNSLTDLAGHSMIPVLVRLSGIPADEKVNSVTRAQRQALVKLFKEFPVNITGKRPLAEAIVTSGGVSVKEINPKTMASKLVNGLYFAGELIDVDAYTGGFNLQIAWSTAFAAATAMA